MGGNFNRAGSDPGKSKMIVSSRMGEQGSLFIELLVALGLSLLILGILQQLMGLVYFAHINSACQAELQYSARMALDCIQRDIRCAQDFQVSPDGRKLMITDAEGKNICIFIQNHNLYRQDVSSILVAENLSAVNFRKSAAVIQGKLELEDTRSNYCVIFCYFSRTLKDYDEGM